MTDHNILLTLAIILAIYIVAQTVITALTLNKVFEKDKPFRLGPCNARNPVIGRGIKDFPGSLKEVRKE